MSETQLTVRLFFSMSHQVYGGEKVIADSFTFLTTKMLCQQETILSFYKFPIFNHPPDGKIEGTENDTLLKIPSASARGGGSVRGKLMLELAAAAKVAVSKGK